jgi:hypothetical protein
MADQVTAISATIASAPPTTSATTVWKITTAAAPATPTAIPSGNVLTGDISICCNGARRP